MTRRPREVRFVVNLVLDTGHVFCAAEDPKATATGLNHGRIASEPTLTPLAGGGFRGWLVVEAEQDLDKAEPLVQALKARRYPAEAAGL